MNVNLFSRLFSLLLVMLLGAEIHAQTFTWVQSAFNSKHAYLNGLAYSNGSLITTGGFKQQLFFGSQQLTDPTGYTAAFTGSFPSTGSSATWLKQSQNPQSSDTNAQGGSCCADTFGNIYVLYYVDENVYFGQTLVATNSPTIVIVKYTANGAVNWIKSFRSSLNGQGAFPLGGYGVVLGANNTLYLILNFKTQLSYGATTFSNSAPYPEGLLLKLDNMGNVQWTQQTPGASITAIHSDTNGNILVGGQFASQVTLSPAVSFTSANGHEFLAKYSDAGSFQWAQQIGGQQLDNVINITTDNNGDVGLCGSFGSTSGSGLGYGSATFGPVTLTTVGNNG